MPSKFVDDMVMKAETIHCVGHALDEKALVIAAKNGNERAFEALVERYRRRIIRVALRFTRVKEDLIAQRAKTEDWLGRKDSNLHRPH